MMKYQCNETNNNINKLQSLTKHSEWGSYKQLNNCKLYFMLTPATIHPHGYEASHWGECGLESQWGHGCLSLVSVVCCQVVVWSLVQWSPNKYGVFVCNCKALMLRSPWLIRDCYAMGGTLFFWVFMEISKNQLQIPLITPPIDSLEWSSHVYWLWLVTCPNYLPEQVDRTLPTYLRNK
jgi:hypothetical protein